MLASGGWWMVDAALTGVAFTSSRLTLESASAGSSWWGGVQCFNPHEKLNILCTHGGVLHFKSPEYFLVLTYPSCKYGKLSGPSLNSTITSTIE